MISKHWLQTVVASILVFSANSVPAQTAVQEWAQRYTHLVNADDFALKVIADSFGNVVVAGRTEGDMVVIKYSGGGIPLWTNGYDGPPKQFDEPTAMVVGGSGSVYLTGRSYGSSASSSFDFATIAYSGNGDALWANRYGGSANIGDQPSGIAVGPNGNILVTGFANNTGTGNDYATIAYSPGGVALWTNHYSSVGNFADEAVAVVAGSQGSVFVRGVLTMARTMIM